MRSGQNLRTHRHSIRDNIYSITACTYNRQPFFLDFNIARTVIRAMRYQDQQTLTDTIAFVVMPDHIHWLFQLKQKSLTYQKPKAIMAQELYGVNLATVMVIGQQLKVF